MKLKILIIFVLVINIIYATPSTSNFSIKETKLTNVTLHHYDGNSIAVYKDKAKPQYYVIPQILLDKFHLDELKKDLANMEDTSITTLALKVSLLTKEVREEIAQELNKRAKKLKIETLTPDDITFPSITQLEIHATIGDKNKLITHYPQNERVFKASATVILQSIPAHIILNIKDSVENLKKFIANPNLELKALTGGFTTKTNSINVKIKNLLSSELNNDLTGDETLKDKITFFNTSQSSGEGINLGIISTGKTRTKSSYGEERDFKRVVSRKHIIDAIKLNASTIDGYLWMEKPSDDFIKRMEAKIFDLYNDIDLKYNEETEKFTNSVFELTLNDKTVADLSSHAKSNFSLKTSRNISAEGVSSEEGMTIKDDNDITWTKKGGTFIPSKITLHQINRTRANTLRDISLDEIYAKAGSFYLISNSVVFDDTKKVRIPAKMVVAFAGNVCPADWREYEPAYGRFIRGIDKLDTKIDPDGERIAGNFQDDEFKEHSHTYIDFYQSHRQKGWKDGGADYAQSIQSKRISDNSGGAETRPKNVALLYCIQR
jgi:hypothetical protein